MDDLISKQDKRAVVNLIDDMNATSFYEANERSKECYYDIRNAILAMPEREPKTGRWTKIVIGFDRAYVRCSECCEWSPSKDRYTFGYNFCPICGAKIAKPQESEEQA